MSYQLLVNKISFGSKGLDIVPKYKIGKILIIKNRLSKSNEIVKLIKRINENDVITIDLSNECISTIDISIILKEKKYQTITKIFSIGGGTIIDFSKRFKFELENFSKKEIEFYIIPSRIGSGAESSSTSIINSNSGKDILINQKFLPNGVIYFTDLYKSLNYNEISMGAIDAVTHCIESMLSINKNNFLDFLSTQTINYVHANGIFKKMINRDNFNESDLKNLSILSFNGGIAQNNAGAGICHALAHAAETITNLKHIECINYFFSPIINYIKLTDNNFENLFNPKIIDLLCQITTKLKSNKKFILLNNIMNDSSETAKLLKAAKKDPCWRLYKKKINIDLLTEQITS